MKREEVLSVGITVHVQTWLLGGTRRELHEAYCSGRPIALDIFGLTGARGVVKHSRQPALKPCEFDIVVVK